MTDTVVELLSDRIDGSIESIYWYNERDGALFGLVTASQPDTRQIYLDTVVVDLDDDTVRVIGDNSMWIPAERNVGPIVRSVARASNSVHAGGYDSEHLQFSAIGRDSETIEQTQIEDDYDPTTDWKAQEGPEQMHKLSRLFDDAGISPVNRFIRLEFGGKAPWSGENKRRMRPPEEIAGNYGVEVNPDDRLVIVDIDDMETAPDMEPTLAVSSPHDGEHRYYAVSDWDRWESVFSTDNPHPSYGEIRATDGYVVGPGSELEDCKHGCCTPDDPGQYQISNDMPIARVSADDLADWINPFRGEQNE